MFWQRNCLYAPLLITWKNSKVEPILSMYGIDTYIWLILMVNVGKCTSPMGGKRGRSNFLLPSWRQHPPKKSGEASTKILDFESEVGFRVFSNPKTSTTLFSSTKYVCFFGWVWKTSGFHLDPVTVHEKLHQSWEKSKVMRSRGTQWNGRCLGQGVGCWRNFCEGYLYAICNICVEEYICNVYI